MNYKSFGQFLFEASEAAEDRKKDKAMVDKLKAAKQAEIKAKKDMEEVERDKESEQEDIAKAKLIHTKANAAATQISADIKLKNLEDKKED